MKQPVTGNQNSQYVKTYHLGESKLWRKQKSRLASLTIELTERCNNNCIHCYINQPEHDATVRSREMSTERIKDILNQAAELGCFNLMLTGGEPLLREDFEEIYLYSRRLGMKVTIATNAALITPYLAQLFKKIPPLNEIMITIYGMKQETYEAVSRKPGSFQSAWDGIQLLAQHKIPFHIRTTVIPTNEADLDALDIWAGTMPILKLPPSYTLSLTLRAWRDSEDKNRIIRQLRYSPEKTVDILFQHRKKAISELYHLCSRSKSYSKAKSTLFICGAGKNMGSINAYGGFQLCTLLRHPETIYNLNNGSMEHAMNDLFVKIRGWQAKNQEYLKKCANCFIRNICEFCPAKSWMETGSVDTPVPYFCETAHAQAKFVGLLKNINHAWESIN